MKEPSVRDAEPQDTHGDKMAAIFNKFERFESVSLRRFRMKSPRSRIRTALRPFLPLVKGFLGEFKDGFGKDLGCRSRRNRLTVT